MSNDDRLLLRLPSELKAFMQAEAEKQGMTLSAFSRRPFEEMMARRGRMVGTLPRKPAAREGDAKENGVSPKSLRAEKLRGVDLPTRSY